MLAQIARGLLRHGQQQTASHLGDRSTYIGLSDVGRAITCLRAAVASKLGKTGTTGDDITRWLHQGENQAITAALGRQLILQRGHWLEAGVESALRANGMKLIPQLEISVTDGDVPLRAHLDFVLLGGGARPALRVLELKSTEHLPSTLYPAYEVQLYGQIGLLKSQWDQPAFSLKNEDGTTLLEHRTFPQICHHLFGINLPPSAAEVEIEGWVLCLSMSEARAFGPYLPDDIMLGLCRRTARTLWNMVQGIKAGQMTLNDMGICSGFHPLCAWCDHAQSCPKFIANPVNDPVLDDELAEFAKLKAERSFLDTEIQVMESRIRQFSSRAGTPSGWLATPRFRFKTTRVPGRKTIHTGKLRAELTNRIGAAEAEAVLARASICGNAYDRLTVSPITPPST